jgi:hypothetical protein
MAAVVRVLSQALARADEAVKLDAESRAAVHRLQLTTRARLALIPCGHLCACEDCRAVA